MEAFLCTRPLDEGREQSLCMLQAAWGEEVSASRSNQGKGSLLQAEREDVGRCGVTMSSPLLLASLLRELRTRYPVPLGKAAATDFL